MECKSISDFLSSQVNIDKRQVHVCHVWWRNSRYMSVYKTTKFWVLAGKNTVVKIKYLKETTFTIAYAAWMTLSFGHLKNTRPMFNVITDAFLGYSVYCDCTLKAMRLSLTLALALP